MGLSEDEVKQIEGMEPIYTFKVYDDNVMIYDTSLVGGDVRLTYYFSDAGLYVAVCDWKEKHSTESLYISDYNRVRTYLTKLYGSPLIDNESWDTTSHGDFYSHDKGKALLYGYLSYQTWFETERSWIAILMSADNYDISLQIFYHSKTNSIVSP